jgi:hypothetical protein
MRRTVICGVLIAILGASGAARAEPTADAPAVVSFDKPPPREGTSDESFMLVTRAGDLVCTLPCSARVPRGAQAEIHWEGTKADWNSFSGTYSWDEYLSVPDPPVSSSTVRAEVRRGKGRFYRALVGTIVSGLILVAGIVLTVEWERGHEQDWAEGVFGTGAIGMGLVGTTVCVTWALLSERPRVDLLPSAPPRPAALRVSISPLRLGGVFRLEFVANPSDR